MLNIFLKDIVAIIVFLAGIFIFDYNNPVYAQDQELIGAGATFPYPLYSKMFDIYSKSYGARVNYQSIGSGGGIRQLLSKTVDFGATDAFMTDDEIKTGGGEIVHIPTCLGAVVITYNLPNSPELKITPEVLAGIFLGAIKKWDDSRIKNTNPAISLPSQNIIVVHRSDGSGTTSIFTDYLSKVSAEWKKKAGSGKSIKWPAGLGAKGNEGVAGQVRQMPGSIGYVELAYTIQNKMPQAAIQNATGNFIKPSLESISLAGGADIPGDTRVMLTNSEAPEGYPISSFTWIIVYKEQNYNNRSKSKAETLLNLLWWMSHEGQKYAAPLDYAPLPKNVVESAEQILQSVTYNGQRILK